LTFRFLIPSLTLVVVFLLRALYKAIRRDDHITFFDLLLAFLTALFPLTALILDNLEQSTFDALEQSFGLIAAGLVIGGLIVIALELRRPARLRQSRGVMAATIGVLLGALTLITPTIGALILIPAQVAALPSATPGPTPTIRERVMVIFEETLDVVASETGLDREEVAAKLDSGMTVASMVSENGGDLEVIIQAISAIFIEQMQRLVAAEAIDEAQGALVISQMQNIVRVGMYSDFTGLLDQLAQIPDELPEEGTPESTSAATAEATAETTAPAIPTGTAAGARSATATRPAITAITPTRTPSPEPTVTAHRTPGLPTLSRTRGAPSELMPLPEITRQRYQSPTPSLTPTLPAPCLLLALYNVNLRAEPSLDADLLTTIPFETAINAYGRDEDTAWWYVEYEGQAGWVSAEYVRATPACAALTEQD
jgi:hypothetical protein